MKKYFIAILAAALVMTGCKNKKAPEKPFEQVQLEEHIKMEVDSLYALAMTKDIRPVLSVVSDDLVVFTDAEKFVKPTYLFEPSIVSSLTRLDQKYRALGMLKIDMEIAALYGNDKQPYKDAMLKLVTDINDPVFKKFHEEAEAGKGEGHSARMKEFYETEKENGRLGFFWDVDAAITVEALYVTAQNADKFLPLLTDQNASDITLRLFLISQSVTALSDYYPGMKELANALKPIETLNAMDVEELRVQLVEMKDELATVRASLLR